MKNFIKSAKIRILNQLKARGYELLKLPPADTTPINVFRLAVTDHLGKGGSGRDNFFFVQIGAHDGMHTDPIRPWVEKYHWRGLLVEPQPKIFKRLVENYKSEPQLSFENAAIASQDGQAKLYTFAEDQGLPDHASMLASFNREALLCNGHGYRGKIEELTVPTLSVASLLRRHKVDHIDLLQIDTEGFDFEILKMFFGQTELRPNIIQFESAFLDRSEYQACCRLLQPTGYRVLTIGIDTIAYLQEDDSCFAETAKNQGYKE
jgi:FkbM family methyltransferase